MDIVTPSQALERGLCLVGFDVGRQEKVRRSKNMERFATHYGSRPAIYGNVWVDLQTTEIPEAKIDPSTTCFEDLLMTAHFLKCYPKENEAEGIFKMSDRTYRDKVNFYLKKLQALKALKIFWPEHWNPNNSNSPLFTLTVDGVHCRIYEPKHGRYSKNPKYYSHKFKQAGLAYEVALSIFDNRCVWINGPFPAGKNDVSIFRAGLKEMMDVGLGVADKGYRGESNLLALPNSQDTEEVREFKARALARHEKFNGQLKNFACLSEQFRHSIEKHQMCFDASAVICQYQLENGSPLMVV